MAVSRCVRLRIMQLVAEMRKESELKVAETVIKKDARRTMARR